MPADSLLFIKVENLFSYNVSVQLKIFFSVFFIRTKYLCSSNLYLSWWFHTVLFFLFKWCMNYWLCLWFLWLKLRLLLLYLCLDIFEWLFMFYGIKLYGFVSISPHKNNGMILLNNDWILPFYWREAFFPSLMGKRYNLLKHTFRHSTNRSLTIGSRTH